MNETKSNGLTTGKIVLIAILAVIVLILLGALGSYNSLVSAREAVDGQWANVETQLQRRIDLIPNLVNTVKGYASHETEVIKSVSDARAKLAGAGTPEDMAAANDELSGALSRLLLVVENYPSLKADTQFTALQDELAGTENRIQVARKDYNDQVQKYNKKIKTFPSVIFAKMFNFEHMGYFQAQNGAETAPTVNF